MSDKSAIRAPFQHLEATSPRTLIKTVASTTAPERLTALNLSGATFVQSGRDIVLTTAGAHYARVNDRIVLSGFTDPRLNTSYDIREVTATTIRFRACEVDQNWSFGGTPAAYLFIEAREILFIGQRDASTNNTSTVRIGELSTDGTQVVPLTSGNAWREGYLPGCKLNLADYWLDVGTNGDGVVVWFK